MQNKFVLIKKIRTQHLPRYIAIAGTFYTQSNHHWQALTLSPVLDILRTTAKRPSHLLLRSKIFNCGFHSGQLYKTFFAYICRFSNLTRF